MNKIAIMQPYFAPYMGYFQLINAVDLFISYDDVNYIKRGWINKNKIKIGDNEHYITIPLKKQSQFKKINEIQIDWKNRQLLKIMKTIEIAYCKSKYKHEVLSIVEEVIDSKPDVISELALASIQGFCKYLKIDTPIKLSSVVEYEKTDDRAINLINICKKEDKSHYINSIGGQKLYDKQQFSSHGVKLNFIQGTPSLSIIDVCMNCSVEEIQKQLQDYKLL